MLLSFYSLGFSTNRQKLSRSLVVSLVSVSHYCACLLNQVTQHFCFLSDKTLHNNIYLLSQATLWKNRLDIIIAPASSSVQFFSHLKKAPWNKTAENFFKNTSEDPSTQINAFCILPVDVNLFYLFIFLNLFI